MNEFEEELRALMAKYGVTLKESENYDNDEGYLGSTYYFVGPGVFLAVDKACD